MSRVEKDNSKANTRLPTVCWINACKNRIRKGNHWIYACTQDQKKPKHGCPLKSDY